MMFHTGEKTPGSLTVCQVSAGRKNRLFLEIHGSKAAAAWNAEQPDELWIGSRNTPNEIKSKILRYYRTPKATQTCLEDTAKNTMILSNKSSGAFCRSDVDRSTQLEYPTFEDGLRQLPILDAAIESSKRSAWVTVAP